MTDRRIRFATQTGGAPSGEEWIARAKRIEALGYGTIAMPDHVVGQSWAPHPALAAVAVATSLRIGTLVLDNDFRNPLITAREAATLDVLSSGRFELGIGAGWHDRDYQSLGMSFDRGRVRVERLIVSYGAGARTPTVADVSFDGARAQLRRVSDIAGARFGQIELSMFVDCAVSDDREATIRELAERSKADPEVTRTSIYRGIGTLDLIQAHLRRVRKELGITYFCLRGPDVEQLGPIVRELAGT